MTLWDWVFRDAVGDYLKKDYERVIMKLGRKSPKKNEKTVEIRWGNRVKET